jgi:hypothetical protein
MEGKRGALSIEVVVSMILVLAVLALLSYFLFREGGTFSREIASCETRGGACIAQDAQCDGRVILAKCASSAAPRCCVSFTGETRG